LDSYLLELNFKDKIFKIRETNPASLSNQLLLDYHRKTHMLYEVAIRRSPPNKKFANSMVTAHNRIVKEMKKRGMKHNTPLKKI